MKKLLQIVALLFIALLSVGMVTAVNNETDSGDVEVEYVKVNGDVYESGDTLKMDLGEQMKIRVKLQAIDDVDDIEVSAELKGYEYKNRNGADQVYDFSDLMDLENGDTEYVDLYIDIPLDADKDEYELRVDVDGRRVSYEHATYTVRVAGPRDSLLIRDVIFSPSGSVIAGRALLTQVRLENIGERDQDDVKVTVSIPALNLEGSVYMDEIEGESSLDRGEKKTSEEIYLRIPACAKEGVYDVDVEVEFDEYDTVSTTETIMILEGEQCTQTSTVVSEETVVDKTLVTAPQTQNVQVGVGGASYPVVIQNLGSKAKTYVVSVVGTETWGTFQISDQAPVIPAGQSKVVYVYVTANEDSAVGVQTFGIEVSTDGAKQNLIAQANLVQPADDGSSLMDYLLIGVIVLVVILILLGLIVVIAKLREKDDEEDDSKGQAYY